jgi:hypothetical protein
MTPGGALMATLINLGFAGLNIEYVAGWEDNPQEGELYVILAVPVLDVTHRGTHHLQLTYRDKQRMILLAYFERADVKNNA